jgi:hypothetical protein
MFSAKDTLFIYNFSEGHLLSETSAPHTGIGSFQLVGSRFTAPKTFESRAGLQNPIFTGHFDFELEWLRLPPNAHLLFERWMVVQSVGLRRASAEVSAPEPAQDRPFPNLVAANWV